LNKCIINLHTVQCGQHVFGGMNFYTIIVKRGTTFGRNHQVCICFYNRLAIEIEALKFITMIFCGWLNG
jgi:hypothetical protein